MAPLDEPDHITKGIAHVSELRLRIKPPWVLQPRLPWNKKGVDTRIVWDRPDRPPGDTRLSIPLSSLVECTHLNPIGGL